MVGNSCIYTASGSSSPSTYILADNSATSDGNITSWCVYMEGGGSGKIKVFRDDGTYYRYIGQSAVESLVNGLNTFSTNIPILIGDYIGFYISGVVSEYDTGGVSKRYYGSDITSDTLKSSWSNDTMMFSVGAIISPAFANVYINSSTGNDSNAGDSCVAGHPVLTFAKAYSLLASGGTIHICNNLADFSTETVTLNKSFSIDLNGADGYFYMPQAS